MIQCLRVDDRLLHGQVITKWLTSYDPDAIVIADDTTVNDAIAKMALRVAKPEGMKMSIRSVDDAIELIGNPATALMKLFVLVKDADSALKIASAHKVQHLNIGGIRSQDKDAVRVSGVVKITPADLDCIRQMADIVDYIDLRTVPSEKNIDIRKFI